MMEDQNRSLVPSGGGMVVAEGDYGLAEPQPASAAGVTPWLHALRRRWLLVALAGMVCGVGAAAGIFFTYVPEYTATAYVRIASSRESLLDSQDSMQKDFDVFKRTQRQLIQLPFVLNAALRDESVAKLPLVQEQIDPLDWLKGEIQVNFPDDAEIMAVSVSGEEPRGLAAMANAVVDAYMAEVVDEESASQRSRLSNLESAYVQTENQLRNQQSELRQLVTQHGAGDTETLNLAQQNALQQLNIMRGHLINLQFEMMKVRGELGQLDVKEDRNGKAKAAGQTKQSPSGPSENVAEEAPQAVDVASAADGSVPGPNAPQPQSVSEMELREAMEADPQATQMSQYLAALDEGLKIAKDRLQPHAFDGYVKKYTERKKEAEAMLAERKETLHKRLAETKGMARSKKIAEMRMQYQVLQQQETELLVEIKSLETESQRFGRSSIDVEIMRTEIRATEDLMQRLGREIEHFKIDMPVARSPITFYSRAEAPTKKSRRDQLAPAAAAGLMAFFAPGLLIVWWDVGKRRINSPQDVTDSLKFNVLGAVPVVPQNILRLSREGASRRKRWLAVLNQALESVVAALFRCADCDQTRVIMITSALPGEGKTTLAGQLAAKLADSGRRTVLLDFDVRRPALDLAFQAELSPGLTEVLTGECDLATAVQTRPDSNLSLITAGEWRHNSLQQLTREEIAGLFNTLRDQYEFVIVDASPLLPTVDARLIGQYVDGVVLSVLRDVTKAPKLQAARELLDTFGIPFLGAVVIGATAADAYYNDNQRDRAKKRASTGAA